MVAMLDFLMFLAACGFLIAGVSLVRGASRGERWIVLKRRSGRSPAEIWQLLERHWNSDALTFQSVTMDPECSPERKSFSARLGGRVHRTTIQRLPSGRPMMMTLTCTSANSIPFPLGREHRKVWVVRTLADGSTEIMVAVRLVAPAGALLQAIRSFTRQLDQLA